MAVKPHTIDIVVADMAKALAFYRLLGLPTPSGCEDEMQVQIATPSCPTIGLVLEQAVRHHDAAWVTPVGQRVTFACQCDTPDEVDATYEKMTLAGYTGPKKPWDAFWGQRYASINDPDGNRVDVFAAISPAGVE